MLSHTYILTHTHKRALIHEYTHTCAHIHTLACTQFTHVHIQNDYIQTHTLTHRHAQTQTHTFSQYVKTHLYTHTGTFKCAITYSHIPINTYTLTILTNNIRVHTCTFPHMLIPQNFSSESVLTCICVHAYQTCRHPHTYTGIHIQTHVHVCVYVCLYAAHEVEVKHTSISYHRHINIYTPLINIYL